MRVLVGWWYVCGFVVVLVVMVVVVVVVVVGCVSDGGRGRPTGCFFLFFWTWAFEVYYFARISRRYAAPTIHAACYCTDMRFLDSAVGAVTRRRC